MFKRLREKRLPFLFKFGSSAPEASFPLEQRKLFLWASAEELKELFRRKGIQPRARGVFLAGGGSQSTHPRAEVSPCWQEVGRHLEVLGEGQARHDVAWPPLLPHLPSRTVTWTRESRLPARGAAWGGTQDLLCPDSLRVSLVAMSRLMAELPVVVSAIALDVNATDTVP